MKLVFGGCWRGDSGKAGFIPGNEYEITIDELDKLSSIGDCGAISSRLQN